ncbi:hypothetical protein KIV56_07605 [Cryobacterium breve]|uniref:Uncharacterized protein n=1 Tax=Cryobacterium breve TaxID=1259258 RepID=A0ABY7NF02_9MICO|nr:hypothetical protein [Cryobacterium breve]WBM81092.1 hypothetical protein KIV56_07605 [Cryobacterium breve]
MPVDVLSQLPTGILLSDTILASEFFAVFSAFVGINTVIYVVLAVAKILPKIYVTDWVRGRNRRIAARSIYAIDETPVRPPPPRASVAVSTIGSSVRRARAPAHPPLRGRAAADHQLAHQHEHERGDEDPDVDERHGGDA